VLLEKRQSSTVAIEICIHVGSNNEEKNQLGVSHFIEHLLFEGTKKRPNSMLIANEIEKLGGEFNAATTNERTIYYAKVPKKHFLIALDVLSDMVQNPLFNPDSVEKERKIILDEINMVTDEPRFHQWILFHKALFKKHPAKNPVYGTKEVVKSISRERIIEYYKKFYVPQNITLSIVGGINGIQHDIKKAFKNFQRKQIRKTNRIVEPKTGKPFVLKEKKAAMQSYAVMGYKVPPRAHRDSYALDVIKGHLSRGQSGTLFQEIRVKHGLCYDVGVACETNIDYGLFAVYVGTHKKNIKKCKDIILRQFTDLENLSDRELLDAKNYIEGEHLVGNEDNYRFADTLSFFQLTGNASDAFSYIKNIKKVTKEDVARIAKKYLHKNYTMAVIEQK